MFVECFKKAFWKSKIKVFISHHTGVSATDVYGREGGDLHMTCLAGARDRFVSWYAVSSSEVLIAYGSRVSPQFPDVTVDHRPIPPSSVSIRFATDYNNGFTALQGSSQTVYCTASGGSPTPTIKLYISNSLVATSTGSLSYSFSPTRMDDRKTIRCVAQNDGTDIPLVAKKPLYLILRPSSPVITEVTTNGTKAFRCSSFGGRSAPNITWTLGSHQINGSQTTILDAATKTYNVSSVVTIPSTVSSSDSAKLNCTLEHNLLREPENTDSTTINPEITMNFISTSPVAEFRSNVTLRCTASKIAGVSWSSAEFRRRLVFYRESYWTTISRIDAHGTNQGTITSSGSYSLYGRARVAKSFGTNDMTVELFINNVNCQDDAEYQCVVNYLSRDFSIKSHEQLLYLPTGAKPQPQTSDVGLSPSKSLYMESETVTASCSGYSGKPPGHYRWDILRKDGSVKEIPSYTRNTIYSRQCTYSAQSSVEIKLGEVDSGGRIRCTIVQPYALSTSSRYQESRELVLATHQGTEAPRVCKRCDSVSLPRYCQKEVTCGTTEICYTREFRYQNGTTLYRLGCEDEYICSAAGGFGPAVGKRSDTRATSLSMCFRCCRDDGCNDNLC
ncbi:hypothetical protein ScPMuIL_016300 [Solemya velum]